MSAPVAFARGRPRNTTLPRIRGGTGQTVRGRQGEDERRADTDPALGPDAAAVGLDDLFGDGQAQPRPAAGPGPRFVGPVEALEDVGQTLRGDAFAGVGHRHLHLASHTFSPDGNRPTSGCVSQRIAEEIEQHLTDPLDVNLHRRQVGRQLSGQRDLLLQGLRLEAIHNAATKEYKSGGAGD